MALDVFKQAEKIKDKLNLDDFFFNDDLIISNHPIKAHCHSFNHGKKTRAYLSSVIGGIYQLNSNKLIQVSRIIEMIHNATLIHDDVVDKSIIRRGSKTLNARVDNKRSVLIGDYMLAKAVSESAQLGSPGFLTQLSLCLKRLVDGEFLQMEAQTPYTFCLEKYSHLASLKTGSLFSFAFCGPLELAGKNADFIKSANTIGDQFGHIFQFKDDLMDFSADSKKTRYLDFKNNNPNIVFSYLGQQMSTDDIDYLLKTETFEELSHDWQKKILDALESCRRILEEKKQKFQAEIIRFINQEEDDQKRRELSILFQKLLLYFEERT